VHQEERVQSALLDDLMQRAFSGSAINLVQRALDNASTSAEDLDAIAKLIAKAKAKARRES
jgi:BlaI family penicillinase repressor